ncbi:MAG TPA: prolipoprotein diacylglyceryl transferase [Nocardioides sp.]|nr:prolipoprotein diacylglyceryl transferase [Nocardioides sp.]
MTTLLTAPIAATIPSPADGVWNLGPVPIRGYALCIIAGIIAAIWIGERRWHARGGRYGDIQDIAIWAVPFGLVGARLYHVATDWKRYFGADSVEGPIGVLYVWHGGLGIWGGVAAGALGAYLGCRAKGIRFVPLMDTVAPGILVAQAIGRWGNWFNQELYGKPTDLPWGLEIDGAHRVAGYEDVTTFHPTFLYECLWNLAAFALIVWLDRRFRIGHGRVMAAYVMAYTLGRGWIEYLRIDDVQLNDVFGLRFNVWTSIVAFLAAAAYFVWSRRRHPGREEQVYDDEAGPACAEPDPDDIPASEP